MNILKRTVLCGVIAASLAASVLAGCGSRKIDGNAAAITVNQDTISMGTANYFLRYQQAETTYLMQMYGMAQAGSLWDYTFSAATSTTEEQTYGSNLKKTVQDSVVETAVLRQHAADYDLTIPEELQTSINDTAAKVFEANKDSFAAMGVSEKNIKEVLELNTLQRLIFYPMTEDTDTEVSDEEAAQSTISYARTALTTYNSETSAYEDKSEEDKNKYKTELTELIAAAGDDAAAADLTALAAEIDSDISVSTYSYAADGSEFTLPNEVLEAAKTLKDGELYAGVIECDDYYYVIRMDAVMDEAATETEKQSIIDERKQTNYSEKLKAWVDAAEVTYSKAWEDLTVTDAEGYTVAAASQE